jgi:hypothetical protein
MADTTPASASTALRARNQIFVVWVTHCWLAHGAYLPGLATCVFCRGLRRALSRTEARRR